MVIYIINIHWYVMHSLGTAESLCFPDKRTVYYRSHKSGTADQHLIEYSSLYLVTQLPADSFCFPEKWTVVIIVQRNNRNIVDTSLNS